MITLPEGTDRGQIEAEFDDGLVQVTVRGGANPEQSTRINVANRSAVKSKRQLEE